MYTLLQPLWKANNRLNLKPKHRDPPMRGNPHFKTVTRSIKSPLFNPLKGIEELNSDYSASSKTLCKIIFVNIFEVDFKKCFYEAFSYIEEKIVSKPLSVLCELLMTDNIEVITIKYAILLNLSLNIIMFSFPDCS